MPRKTKDKVAPNILGRLYSANQPKPRYAQKTPRQKNARGPTPFVWTMPPTLTTKTLIRKLGIKTNAMYLPPIVATFAWVDHLYTQFDSQHKAVWKAAVKKHCMSAYDLWMKEAMTLIASGFPPPDTPSISGGWSAKKAIPGTTHGFPPCADPCPVKRVELKYWKNNPFSPHNEMYRVVIQTSPLPSGYEAHPTYLGIGFNCTGPSKYEYASHIIMQAKTFPMIVDCPASTPKIALAIAFTHTADGRYHETWMALDIKHPWIWTKPHQRPWDTWPSSYWWPPGNVPLYNFLYLAKIWRPLLD